MLAAARPAAVAGTDAMMRSCLHLPHSLAATASVSCSNFFELGSEEVEQLHASAGMHGSCSYQGFESITRLDAVFGPVHPGHKQQPVLLCEGSWET